MALFFASYLEAPGKIPTIHPVLYESQQEQYPYINMPFYNNATLGGHVLVSRHVFS
jgi:hypothetical protein